MYNTEKENNSLRPINLKLNEALNCWTQVSLKPGLDIYTIPKFSSYKVRVLINNALMLRYCQRPQNCTIA